MSYQDWLPAAWKHSPKEDTPFHTPRQQIDHMFEDFDNGFFDSAPAFAVRSDVPEPEDEICVTAELSGLTVTVAKPAEVAAKTNKIDVKHAT